MKLGSRSAVWWVVVVIVGLLQMVEALEAEVANVEDDIDDVETDIDNQDRRIAVVEDTADLPVSVDDTIELLLEKMAELEGANNLLQERVEFLENTVEDQDKIIATMEATDNCIFDGLLKVKSEAAMEACSSSPCTNGATCVDVNVDTFVCLCRGGFFGITCEQSYTDTSFLATFRTWVVEPPPNEPMVFSVPVLNNGGHYDDTTGIYTVPLDGLYEFVVHVVGSNDFAIDLYLIVDELEVTYTYVNGETETYDERLIESTALIPLTAGQEVYVRTGDIDGMFGEDRNTGMYSWFTGHLVYAV